MIRSREQATRGVANQICPLKGRLRLNGKPIKAARRWGICEEALPTENNAPAAEQHRGLAKLTGRVGWTCAKCQFHFLLGLKMALQRKHHFAPESSAKILFSEGTADDYTPRPRVCCLLIFEGFEVTSERKEIRVHLLMWPPAAGLFWAWALLDATDRSQLCEQRLDVASRWTDINHKSTNGSLSFSNKLSK